VNALLCRGTSADDALSAIRFLDDVTLLVVPLGPDLLADAARLASSGRLALYDAVFVALAAELDAELVTADRQQAASSECRTRLVGG